jgi:hypothetical protein
VPFFLLFIFCLYICFRITINYRVSLLLRKYCFLGIILLMPIEGNIEQYTFFIVNEFRVFFCFTFAQKLGNIFVLFFSFFIIVSSTAIYFIFWIYYKNKVKYLIGEANICLTGIFSYTIDKNFFCFILGIIHSCFINLP